MLKALAALAVLVKPEYILVDGNVALSYEQIPAEAVVGGDRRSLAIAAASIIAKETRDRIMLEIHQTYPEYGFDRHKGYSTPKHLHALSLLGPTPIHRFSFAPLKMRYHMKKKAQNKDLTNIQAIEQVAEALILHVAEAQGNVVDPFESRRQGWTSRAPAPALLRPAAPPPLPDPYLAATPAPAPLPAPAPPDRKSRAPAPASRSSRAPAPVPVPASGTSRGSRPRAPRRRRPACSSSATRS